MLSHTLSNNKISFFLLLSLISHLVASYFSYGAYSPDEQFCILEYVNYIFGYESEVCFSYYKIRSWFQPYTYFIIAKTLSFFNITHSLKKAPGYSILKAKLDTLNKKIMLEQFKKK